MSRAAQSGEQTVEKGGENGIVARNPALSLRHPEGFRGCDVIEVDAFALVEPLSLGIPRVAHPDVRRGPVNRLGFGSPRPRLRAP